MNFDEQTYENILTRMITRVQEEYPELDTREASLIYTALAPAALELESMYHELSMVATETFAETASREYLIKHCQQVGLEMNEGTYGEFYVETNVELELGHRFNLDKFNYIVIEPNITLPNTAKPYYVSVVQCETMGEEPNPYRGTLTPISYVPGLNHAELVDIKTYGEYDEDTEALRERYFLWINSLDNDGNINFYKSHLENLDDVGKYKVEPLWNGLNTVRLRILNSNNTAANADLIQEVQDHFDPTQDGMGNGVAPIGAIVTVDTVSEVPVTIKCSVKLNDGYSELVGLEEEVLQFFKDCAFEKYTVEYMPIYAIIYNNAAVNSIESLTVTVNGTNLTSSNKVTLTEDQIAVLNTEDSTWSVV